MMIQHLSVGCIQQYDRKFDPISGIPIKLSINMKVFYYILMMIQHLSVGCIQQYDQKFDPISGIRIKLSINMKVFYVLYSTL